MIRLLLVLTIFCPKIGADLEDVLFKIIGGDFTKIDPYPYLGCMLYQDVPRCGAALISYKHVLTAAHCTKGTNACSMKIRFGSTYNSFGGETYQVLKIMDHPMYNKSSKENDLSVLQLDGNVPPTIARPIGIADYRSGCCPPGVMAEIMGWGTTEVGAKSGSVMLQCTRVPMVSREVCQKAYSRINRRITKNMICAGDMTKGGSDTCQGDSGGPLVWDNLIVGVVSFGKGCGNPDYPGVYVNTQNYLPFLLECVGHRG